MRKAILLVSALLLGLPAGPALAGGTTAAETTSVTPAPADAETPESVAERDKLITELFDRLRGAKDAATAERIAASIERLWIYSGSDTADLLLNRAGQAIEGKQTEAARQVLDALIGLEPRYAEAWNRRAYLDFSEQNYQAALTDLSHVLAIEPRHFKALEGLAAIMKEIGQNRLALKAYRKLLEINPQSADAKTAVEGLAREVEGQKI